MTTDRAVRTRAGGRVRTFREQRGLTVRQLATAVHVSPATVTAIEHGRTSITVERLVALADVLQVDPAALLDAEPAAPAAPGRGSRDWRTFEAMPLAPALTGAARAFVTTGYHGATVRSIALAAGISPAGIYHHYASKHDLLRELMTLGMDDLLWRVEAARDEAEDPVQRVALIVEATALWHARRHEIAIIGASEMRSLDPAAHRSIVAFRRRVQEILDDAVLDALPPDADRGEALAAARGISTMCTSIAQWFRPDGESSADEIARQHSRFALRLLELGRP
ncbi:helix-turn-helix domain-containing protein [Barrientosiimonas endolithica]|uniref:helix-turn-helix domain-containing protein n=1 Tax=Barrientosiimonas endolithica TaxID=1535208 RepID=UPI00259AF18D|nr:helix-turn-helix domain-containing protein [Barrientosiimonas endolithica]